MAKKTGLGRGLEVLLASSAEALSTTGNDNNIGNTNDKLQELPLSSLQAGKYQPRRIFDETELQELADSIRHNGIIQPLVVRKVAPQRYEIIAGERRFRASQIAGIEKIPVVIREFSDEEALAISLIENIQRQDLNIVEEAEGYRRLIDEFGLTHEALAQVTGKSRSNISNTLRLLNLSSQVLEMLLERRLDMGHARALLPLSEEKQIELAEVIVAKKLTTAEVENQVARILHELRYGANPEKAKKSQPDPDIISLEQALADRLGMMVAVKHNRSGSGKITINYNSVDELDGFLELLALEE